MTAMPLRDFTDAEREQSVSLSDPEFTPLSPPVRAPGTPGKPHGRPVDRDLQFEIDDNGCFVLTKNMGSRGYGELLMYGRKHFAHRAIWLDVVGQIAPGMVLDHLCRNPPCINPDHMEVVTPRENVLRGESHAARQARKTHCKRGHEFTDENTGRACDGTRICRTCKPARVPLALRPHDANRYKLGCRCEECRAAQSVRNAANYAKRKSA